MMMPHEKGTFVEKLLVFQKPKAPIRDSESLRQRFAPSCNYRPIPTDQENISTTVASVKVDTKIIAASEELNLIYFRENEAGQRIIAS